MASISVIALLALCACTASATQFGYAPGELIVSIDDVIQHAFAKILKLGNNYKRMAGNAAKDGTNLLQALKIQSSDPEGLLALITETKMAINLTKSQSVDVSSCETGNDARYQAIIKESGPGIVACLQNASAELDPYFQHLKDLVAASQEKLGGANGNVTDCVNAHQGDMNGTSDCLQVVGGQVFYGRDVLMAAILSVMADFKTQTGALVAEFTQCTNDVQDKAIAECVDIIKGSRDCFKKQSSSNSTPSS